MKAKKKAAKKFVKKQAKAGTSKAAAELRKNEFAHAYIANGRNGTAAAIAAGCPPRGAHVAAARLLKDAKVVEIIAQAVEKAAKKAEFTSEETILSMARAVRFDPRKLYAAVLGDDGNPMVDDKKRPLMRMLETWELDDDTALALQSVEYDEIKGERGVVIGQTTKLKACDRNTAREQAHKFFGHYDKDNAQRQPQVIIVATEMDERV